MSDIKNAAPGQEKPQFRNISVLQVARYSLPLPGKVSILHRISGAAMFLLLPWVLYIFDQSVSSEISFEVFKAVVGNPFAKLILLGLIWAYLHHFCAGIRYLLLDLHIGIDKAAARKSAGVVLAVSLSLAALCGLKLFGVF